VVREKKTSKRGKYLYLLLLKEGYEGTVQSQGGNMGFSFLLTDF